jgi:hypothetical protein
MLLFVWKDDPNFGDVIDSGDSAERGWCFHLHDRRQSAVEAFVAALIVQKISRVILNDLRFRDSAMSQNVPKCPTRAARKRD